MKLFMTEFAVASLERSLYFYRDILGMILELHDSAGRFVLLKSGTSRLALKEGPTQQSTATLYFEVENLRYCCDQLAAQGVNATGGIVVSPEGYERLDYLDPDGYKVGIFAWKSIDNNDEPSRHREAQE